MADSIGLVGRQVCEECDAFLGKSHKDGCSKGDRAVIEADTTEKFTTVEHAEEEEPLLGIDPDAAELILRNLQMPAGEDYPKLVALGEGLKKFIEEAA